MSSYNLVLWIVFPVFIAIIAALFFLVIKDADKEIEEYEKKTGKKIKVSPLKISKETEGKIEYLEKIINKPLEIGTKEKKKLKLNPFKNKKTSD